MVKEVKIQETDVIQKCTELFIFELIFYIHSFCLLFIIYIQHKGIQKL